MPQEYSKVHLAQLVSAIWSKYLSLQGGDVETQRQLLEKEKEIFQREKEIQELKVLLQNEKAKDGKNKLYDEFRRISDSGKLNAFITAREDALGSGPFSPENIPQTAEAVAFGFIEPFPKNAGLMQISERGKEFFKWLLLENNQ
jgi:hypothetical protein